MTAQALAEALVNAVEESDQWHRIGGPHTDVLSGGTFFEVCDDDGGRFYTVLVTMGEIA